MNGNLIRRTSQAEQELYWLSATAAISGVNVSR